jgi:hypothetical protein
MDVILAGSAISVRQGIRVASHENHVLERTDATRNSFAL